MVAILITSFLLLAVIIYAVYRLQESPYNRGAQQERALTEPRSGWSGLFGEEAEAEQKQLAEAAASAERESERSQICARAERGEKAALLQARAWGDDTLYEEVLNRLIDVAAGSDKKILALVSYMTRETPPLRVSRRLAERFMQAWEASPDRSSTAKMLHVTALANDAALYRAAIETALDFWRRNLIPDLSAVELRSLSESEYWILSQSERSSGQGFLLKLKLAALRRELNASRGAKIGDGG
jgi:hypothetical protein